MSMLYHDIHEGLAKMPTGTGKTTYFSEILYALGEPAMVKVPRRLLIPQTMRELMESGYDVNHIFSLPPYEYDEKEDKFSKIS